MDVAERDQFKAHCQDSAERMRIHYDAILACEFTAEQAIGLLTASLLQSAGALQAQAIDRMTEDLKRPPEDA